MSTTTRKKDAPRHARPVGRYWKGRAPKGVDEIQDDLDSEVDEAEPIGTEDVLLQDDFQLNVDDRQSNPAIIHKVINIALKDVNISQEGKDIHDLERSVIEGSSSDETTEEVDEDEDESSDEDEFTEETKPIIAFRPVFVPKRGRVTLAANAAELDLEEVRRRREKEAETRRKQSHDLVGESIKRELVEKETEEHVPDVDDTDDLDPTAEFEDWRLRELSRIKRDKEEQFRREEEKAEIERRRALPEETRLKEDLERAQKSRDEKPKGNQKFLQKYWHKGAFHQDYEILKRHDYTEATSSTVDVTLLPKIMQVRDFGKRSRTKYTHLLDQDTTVGSGGFGGVGPTQPSTGQGCFSCGGPHLKKDCPQLGLLGSNPAGANKAAFESATFNTENIKGRDDSHGEMERNRHNRRSTSPWRTTNSARTRRRDRSENHPRERDYIKKQRVD
ncbi:hypothetical protein Clacol_008222 [Clathrus columnatus]|uniref:Micro-fibrillar-associated protein 1 C-terminal domain-containing protein n=1 Tax=Clathrus columnatus TaxID=1419009 RepID=A0AAV5AHV6_9AGAM|nr:hypothetical protein Clacol_008222 [Clathrus columnatus]